jgi:hypothetical protein
LLIAHARQSTSPAVARHEPALQLRHLAAAALILVALRVSTTQRA